VLWFYYGHSLYLDLDAHLHVALSACVCTSTECEARYGVHRVRAQITDHMYCTNAVVSMASGFIAETDLFSAITRSGDGGPEGFGVKVGRCWGACRRTSAERSGLHGY
jgi:hypothetical protein